MMEIPRRTSTEFCVPSSAQRRLWFLDQLYPNTPTYNVPRVLRISGPLDVEALRQSVSMIATRHEALRTGIQVQGGEPRLVVKAAGNIEIPVIDLRDVPHSGRHAAAMDIVDADLRRGFDLAVEPMIRSSLLRIEAEEHLWVLTIHHIATDGWSQRIFDRELTEIYAAKIEGRSPVLEDLPIQYSDYAEWQNGQLQDHNLDELGLDYWRDHLKGIEPQLSLPWAKSRKSAPSRNGADISFDLSKADADAVRRLARNARFTSFGIVLALLKVLLHRYSDRTDIPIGCAMAGRESLQTHGIIGLFVNTVIYRTDLSGDPTFSELVDRIREVWVNALRYSAVPFEKIVEELRPVRQYGLDPLVQVMLSYDQESELKLDLAGTRIVEQPVSTGTAKFDCTIGIQDRADTFAFHFNYDLDLYDAETIRRAFSHFVNLLRGASADPECRISRIDPIGQAERHKLLVARNDTRTSYPPDTIHALFEQQARRRPQATAIEYRGRQISYCELDKHSSQIANQILSRCDTPAVCAVCAERSPEALAALLGVLKAGAAYLPLSPSDPPSRIRQILAESAASLLITQRALGKRLRDLGAGTIFLDDPPGSASDTNPGVSASARDPAYVMYTSGSTGTPKGVVVPHRGVVRLVFGQDYVSFGPDEAILHMAPLAFDASTLEIWGALLHGGRCVICPERIPDPAELGDLIANSGVTTMWLTSAFFNLVIDETPEVLRSLPRLIIGGEALSVRHVRRALEVLPTTEITNGYGPSEGTTFTCCYRIPRPLPAELNSIPIGRPIGNTAVYILDSHGQPVPEGVAGELFIGGDGVALGYLNQPELSKEAFVQDPFSPNPGSYAYRSGDFARWLPDGNIEFLGRKDAQVKVRGFRIELEGIAATIERHEAVNSAVASLHQGDDGVQRIVAHVVRVPGSELESEELREFVAACLPGYEIPSQWVWLDRLPITPNGKVDRGRLSIPEPERPSAGGCEAPISSNEARMIDIWKEMLGRSDIGVTDSFFDLGGHSLLAVQMLIRVRKALDLNLSIADLFAGPTIRALAAMKTKQEAPAVLVPIRTGGSKPPVFFVHGIGGTIVGLYDLAARLDPQRPVYGLQASGLENDQAPDTTIEQMATRYIAAIRSVQPAGPYALAGLSIGGVVAHQIAIQLKNAGQETSFLGLLDCGPLGRDRLLPVYSRTAGLARNWMSRAKLHWQVLRETAPAEWRQYFGGRLRTLRRRLKSWLWRFQRLGYQVGKHELPQRFLDVRETLWMAAKTYRPKPYEGSAVLFRSSDPGHCDSDLSGGWSDLVRGGLQIREVPGTHLTFTTPPNVDHLAQELESCLRSAE